jgi:capsular polysaccharide transport system permease protein
MLETAPRSRIAITLSVWNALLLREALSRLFGRRVAWFWLLTEPVFHIAYLMFLFAVVRVRHVGGIDTPLWIMLGLLGYFMFQRPSRQAAGAITANRQLFAYRQVLPVDTVISRALLEGFLMVVVTLLLLVGAGAFGFEVWPDDPLRALVALLGLWCCGLGFGLLSSVAIELTPELGRVLNMLTRPLYMISGVVFPIGALPPPFRDWLMLNPLAHALEAIRLGFAPYYHAVPGVSMGYVFGFALVLLVAGLGMQVAFERRMVAE